MEGLINNVRGEFIDELKEANEALDRKDDSSPGSKDTEKLTTKDLTTTRNNHHQLDLFHRLISTKMTAPDNTNWVIKNRILCGAMFDTDDKTVYSFYASIWVYVI